MFKWIVKKILPIFSEHFCLPGPMAKCNCLLRKIKRRTKRKTSKTMTIMYENGNEMFLSSYSFLKSKSSYTQ